MTQDTAAVGTGPVTGVPGRELALARAFADLAGGLVGEVDVPDLLHRLTEHCVELVQATGCGILLTDTDGTLQLLAAAPEATQVLELLQLQEDQGPCVDCVQTGEPVSSRDLAADTRWPRWTPTAVHAGIGSVYATPLRTPGAVIGALNLFGVDVDATSPADLLVVRALADVATLTLLHQRDTERAAQLNTQLRAALTSRIVIEQAKGVIVHALTLSVDEAFAVFRYNARSTNTKLTVLADALVTGRITAADLLPVPDPTPPGRR